MRPVAGRRPDGADPVADRNRVARPAEPNQYARAFALDRPPLASVAVDDDDRVRVRPRDRTDHTGQLDATAAVEAEDGVMRTRVGGSGNGAAEDDKDERAIGAHDRDILCEASWQPAAGSWQRNAPSSHCRLAGAGCRRFGSRLGRNAVSRPSAGRKAQIWNTNSMPRASAS